MTRIEAPGCRRCACRRAARVTLLALKSYPWQPNPSQGLAGGYRYLGDAVRPELAVGMRVDVYQPLLWVRWHSGTIGFTGIEPRLKSAGHRPERHDGHLWLALTMTPQLGPATEQIANLSAQVVTLFNIAAAAGEAPSLAPTAEPSPAAAV